MAFVENESGAGDEAGEESFWSDEAYIGAQRLRIEVDIQVEVSIMRHYCRLVRLLQPVSNKYHRDTQEEAAQAEPKQPVVCHGLLRACDAVSNAFCDGRYLTMWGGFKKRRKERCLHYEELHALMRK